MLDIIIIFLSIFSAFSAVHLSRSNNCESFTFQMSPYLHFDIKYSLEALRQRWDMLPGSSKAQSRLMDRLFASRG